VLPVVCLISGSQRLGADRGAALARRVAAAARAGVHLIQVRERDESDLALLELTRRVLDAVRGTRARVLVNDRIDVAMAAGAHGVHLRGDSVPSSRARAIAPRGFLIGRSVHSTTEARVAAREGGADYLLFGTVFPTESKPGRAAAGVEALAEVVAAVPTMPVLAVGGITPQTIAAVRESGCAGVAAIGLFADCREESIPGVVSDVRAAWENRG
jgi:thiamine-phosphate pyrophosphorylase